MADFAVMSGLAEKLATAVEEDPAHELDDRFTTVFTEAGSRRHRDSSGKDET
jgi:hypothetical protein